MKFLLVLCLVAFAAADDDSDKKTQAPDTTLNTSNFSQTTGSLLNSQVFPPTTFGNAVPGLAYSGFTGNLSPIQTVNPDFFTAPVQGVTTGVQGVSPFPVTRGVLPGTSGIVNGIQSVFPVGGSFPQAISGIASQFPAIVSGIISGAGGVPGGALDANTANTNTPLNAVPAATYRFLAPEALTTISNQAQTVGIPPVPAFTGGVLTPLANGVFQGQNIPTAVFQGQNIPTGVFQGQNIPAGVLKTPTGTPTGIPNVPGLTPGNISSGPLTTIFRQ